MANHLLFFRLPRGKVWHVSQHASPVALCGEDFPLVSGEEQPGRPPYGGRPCPRCAEVAIEAQTALTWAELAHVARQSEVIDEGDGDADASEAEPKPEVLDLVADPRSSIDAAMARRLLDAAAEDVEDLDLCICGHPLIDHGANAAECWARIPADDDGPGMACACIVYICAGVDA